MTDAQHKPGAVLGGRYKLGGLLGSGGMGTVFAAEHLLLRKQVAIKLLRSDYSSDADLAERFLREARTVSQLEHPHIIRVSDVAQEPSGDLYMVMEHLRGETLHSVLERHRVLTVQDTIAVASPILAAVSYAHDQGIVHRDLKPDNVFLLPTQSGQAAIDLRVLDFGISKQLSSEASSPRLTQTGAILGTPFYMSPEQASGAPSIDHRSDIWSLGVMLYQMLSGELPYRGDSYNQIMVAIVVQPVPALRAVAPDLPEALTSVIEKALAKDPDARFQTVGELADALTDFVMDGGQALSFEVKHTPLVPVSVDEAVDAQVGTAETVAADSAELSSPEALPPAELNEQTQPTPEVIEATERPFIHSTTKTAASFGSRLVALLIDVFVFGLVIGAVVDAFSPPERILEVRVDEPGSADAKEPASERRDEPPSATPAKPGIAITGKHGEQVTVSKSGVRVVKRDGTAVNLSAGEDELIEGGFDGIRVLVDDLKLNVKLPNPLKTSLWVLYCTLFLAFFAATPGKMVLGLRVEEVGAQGATQLPVMTALIRSAFFFLSALPLGLGCLWALFGTHKSTWHDSVAKTRVVRAR